MFKGRSSLVALASVMNVDLGLCRMHWISYSCAIICCSFHVSHLLRPYFTPMCSLVEMRIDRINICWRSRKVNTRVKSAGILKAAQSCSVFQPGALSFHSIWVTLFKNISTKTAKHILFLTFFYFLIFFCLCKEKWTTGFKIMALYISSEVCA